MSLNDRMATCHDLTTAQLKQAIQSRGQIEELQAKFDALLGGSSTPTKAKTGRTNGKRVVSAATKRKMAAAQQARRAKTNRTTAKTPVAKKKDGMTLEGKAKIAAAMKARWAAKRAAATE